jgi:hypothetical protein
MSGLFALADRKSTISDYLACRFCRHGGKTVMAAPLAEALCRPARISSRPA